MRYSFTIIFLILGLSVFAQKGANNWIIHLDNYICFNSGTSELITPPNGECGGWEVSYCDFFFSQRCCASISDADGNLVLYSNGEVVWNAGFDTINYGNVFMGDMLTNQILFIPRPDHPNRYYLITTDYINYLGGARWSEIDITTNNGIGSTIPLWNNILLSNTTQKVTAVYHKNGKDIWLMLHEFNSDAFYAYLVTPDGFSSTPVISNIGTIHENQPGAWGPDSGTSGQMKFSPNGKRLAVAIRGLDLFEVFDFDNETGEVANPISINVEGAQSVEFSQNGTVVYAGNSPTPIFVESRIYQVDLLAGDSLSIVNSFDSITLGNYPNYWAARGFIQLAPNGKIFHAGGHNDYISTIESPDIVGLGCNYNFQSFNFPSSYCGSGSKQTLPNVFCSFLDRNILFENTCYEDSTLICTQTNMGFDSIRWEFEDPVGILNTIPNQDTVYHVFSEPGGYEITLKRYRNGFEDETDRMLYIEPVIDLNLGNDTIICEGTELEVIVSDTFVQYGWVNDFSLDTILSDTANIGTSGNWWPILTNFDEYCGNIDTINVSLYPDSLDIGNDTANACISSPLIIDATLDSATYLWSTSETTASIIATISNYYIVEVTQGYCTFTDTIHILYDEPLIVDLPDTSIVCDSIPIELSVIDILADYLWSPTGEATPEIMVNNPGLYSVTASNGCGDFIDSTTVLSLPSPVVNLGNDTIICSTDSILLDASNWLLSGVVVWSTGSTDSSIWVSTSGQYFVTITNECGNAYDSILIETENPIIVNLGNDTIICFGESLLISPEIIGEGVLQWSNGETTQEIIVTGEGEYILSVTNVCGEFADTLNLSVQINDFTFTEDTIFIHGGDSAVLSGPDSTQNGVEVFEWSTGEGTQNITVSNTGTFWLTFIDSIGCEATDSIIVSWYVTIAPIYYLDNIKIFPNPTSNELIIDGLKDNDEIRIYDVLGKEQPYKTLSNQPYIMDFKNQHNGIYLLRIKRNNEVRVFKIIKQ